MSQGAELIAADSAGQPWAGRHFEPNTSADDDGSADVGLLTAIRSFRSGSAGEADVVRSLRGARLLVPLVAHLGEAGENEHGQLVDKTQELAIVTVRGPDGRTVLPAFTSVEAMRAWNPLARPVPAQAVRVAVAAASEQTDLVVLDPRSDTEFAVIAQHCGRSRTANRGIPRTSTSRCSTRSSTVRRGSRRCARSSWRRVTSTRGWQGQS